MKNIRTTGIKGSSYSVRTGITYPPNTLYNGGNCSVGCTEYQPQKETHQMSFIYMLIRNDYIIAAAESRRGL